jgi:hypothetical protein
MKSENMCCLLSIITCLSSTFLASEFVDDSVDYAHTIQFNFLSVKYILNSHKMAV